MKTDRVEGGLTLVQVALLLVVLIAFAALAVDGGRIYLERRRMQNAADAGALAGAYQRCFGTDGVSPLVKAEQYAIQQNGAAWARATYPGGDTWKVSVVATTTLDLGLADVVGLPEVVAGANATAQCGKATTSGGLWPLTVKIEPDWNSLACEGNESVFTVFTQQSQEIECYPRGDCDCQNPVLGSGQMYPNNPNYFVSLLNSGAVTRLGPGQRGWADLPEVPPPGANPGGCGGCGGASNLACWMLSTHPGPVKVCDRLGSESGVSWSDQVREAVEYHTDHETVIKIPLWDYTCPSGEVGQSSCNGNYLVAGFGCIRALGYAPISFKRVSDPTKWCNQNVKIIFARKLCDCKSYSGGTSGETCDPPNVCAVSLIE